MIEEAMLEVAASLGVSSLAVVAQRSPLGADIRRCVWSVAMKHGRTAASLSVESVMGQRWRAPTIREACRTGYRLRYPWPAAEAVAERVLYPKRKGPEPRRETFDECVRVYLAGLCSRHATQAAAAKEAGLTRHSLRRHLLKWGVTPPWQAASDARKKTP